VSSRACRRRIRSAGGAATLVAACAALAVGCGGDPDQPPAETPDPPGEMPYETLSEYGFFVGEMAAHDPAPGVVLYEVAASLWADHAEKKRFFVLPEGGSAEWTEGEDWRLPLGTIIIKAFSFPADLREPAGPGRAIETRLLILEDEGWTGHTYVWNDEQTEAHLEVAGVDVEVSYVDLAGEAQQQTYLVPNNNQCEGCHARDDENHLLGVMTQQLNRRVTRDGSDVEQLTWLADQGLFGAAATSHPSPEALPRFADPFGDEPLDARARAYLAANCAHCHRPGGGGGDSGLVLLASEQDLSKFGVCKTPAAAGAGTGGRTHDIVPGHPEESIMTFRMQSTDPEIKMPELPNLLPDDRGVELITEWIAAMEPQGCQ
jgi:uncharacterized repeat protein (TIGR03806 family)